jgi:hypothetical protein
MSHPYNMPWYFHPNNICKGIKVIKLVIMQNPKVGLIKFSSTSYSNQRPLRDISLGCEADQWPLSSSDFIPLKYGDYCRYDINNHCKSYILFSIVFMCFKSVGCIIVCVYCEVGRHFKYGSEGRQAGCLGLHHHSYTSSRSAIWESTGKLTHMQNIYLFPICQVIWHKS